MMIFLGVLDIVSALMLLAMAGGADGLPIGFVIFISAYLIIKGIFFSLSDLNFDFSNLLDVIAGATILITIFVTPPILVLIVLAVSEGSKGIFSLAA